MSLQWLIGVAVAVWLLSMIAVALAFRWSFRSVRDRFLAAIVLSIGTLLIGYIGLTRLHVTASKTVNGVTQWRFDSRWLFTLSLILGAAVLAYTLWKRRSLHGQR